MIFYGEVDTYIALFSENLSRIPLSDCREILKVPVPTTVVGFYPIPLTLSLVGINLLSKVYR